jgi:ankyrin repeat protein
MNGNYGMLTPLVMAAKRGHENAMLLLLEHGAKSVNNVYSNRTPLSWAAEHGLEKAVK